MAPKYNLTNLSWQEFENLAFKCLQLEVSPALQFVEGGNDKGRDFIFKGITKFFGDTTNELSIVFQAKHKTGSDPFTKLNTDLKAELVKVYITNKQTYDVYCLVSNLQLSGGQIDSLNGVFQEFVKENNLSIKVDLKIIAYRNLESAIEKHRYLQLSFPSILSSKDFETLLSGIINRGTSTLTTAWIDTFTKNRSRFVFTSIYDVAAANLKEENTVLLSGPPKSGKTFTAEMLILRTIGEGKVTPYLVDHLDTFFNVYDKSVKQLFLFDDVFGRHDLDLYRADAIDRKFTYVFELIDDDHQCIFTSREYIVRSFINRSGQDIEKYLDRIMVETSRLSNGEKESLLIRYMSLKFPHEHLSEQHVAATIAHKNFSPETIRAYFDEASLFNILDFFKHLDMPDKYLEKVFNNLPDEKRIVLLALLFSLLKTEDSIAWSFRTLCQDLNKDLLLNLRTELSILEGSLIQIYGNRFSFYHPSMIDFFQRYLSNDIATYRSLLLGNINLDLLSVLRFKVLPNQNKLIEVKGTEIQTLLAGLTRLINNPYATLFEINTILYWLTGQDIMLHFQIKAPAQFNSFRDAIRSAITLLSCDQKRNGNISELEDFLELVNLNRDKITLEANCLKQILHSTRQHPEFWRVAFKIAPLLDETSVMDETLIGKNWLNDFFTALRSEVNSLGYELYGDAYPKFEEVERYKTLIAEKRTAEANAISHKNRTDYKLATRKNWYPRYRIVAEKMTKLKVSHPFGYKIHQRLISNFQHLTVLEDNQKNRYLYNRMHKWWTD